MNIDLSPRTMAQVATFTAVHDALDNERLHTMLMLLLSLAYLEGQAAGIRQLMREAQPAKERA